MCPECPKIILLGTKRVAVARHGLILWENEATSLRIILKCFSGQKNQKTIKKSKNLTFPRIFFYIDILSIYRFGGRYVLFMTP